MSEGALREPVRPSVIRSLLGLAVLPAAAIVATPMLFALGAGDLRFALRAAISLGALLALWLAFRGGHIGQVRRSEARVAASLLYLLVPLAMTLPMSAHARLGVRDALFESISAFTTTGMSVMDANGAAPALLFARAWLAWIGGLTAVALAITVLTPPDPTDGQRAPALSIPDQLKRATVAYTAITAAVAIALCLTGLAPLRALLHAFGAVSTGAMTPDPHGLHDLAPATRIVSLTGALLGSLPLLWLGGGASMAAARLARWQLVAALFLIAGTTAAVALSMRHFGVLDQGATPWDAAMFAVSAQTSLGLEPIPTSTLDPSSKLALCMTMACGGSVGSAAGGIKLLRLFLLFVAVRRFVIRATYRRGSAPPARLLGLEFDDDTVRRVLVITVLFCVTVLLSWLPFVYAGKPPLETLFDVVSATANCGLATGAALNEVTPGLQFVLVVDMLLGRLEFLAILLALYPGSWIGDWRARALEALDAPREV